MFRRGGRSGGLGLGEIDLELDRDLVLQLERAEEATVRLDPEGRLLHGSGSPVPAGSGPGIRQRYRPDPGSDICSRTGCVLPLIVSVPSIAPPLAPKRLIFDEAKLAVELPRMLVICFLISRRSPSVSGLAPPDPSRTSSEPRSRSALTCAAVTPPASSAGTSTC